jgi:predicted MPP superfamily phosphohydrolase
MSVADFFIVPSVFGLCVCLIILLAKIVRMKSVPQLNNILRNCKEKNPVFNIVNNHEQVVRFSKSSTEISTTSTKRNRHHFLI